MYQKVIKFHRGLSKDHFMTKVKEFTPNRSRGVREARDL